jgi:cytochrome c-type biogenesis protein CcmH
MRAIALIPAVMATLLACASPAAAVQPGEQLADKALEQRARDLSAGLRCLVCQNQSIDDSDAPLAKDLRLLVRERLNAGDSDTAVRDFVVSRYGAFVLLKPPFALNTLLLWISPFALLVMGMVALWRRKGFQAKNVATETSRPLDADEEARLAALLHGNAAGKNGPDRPAAAIQARQP